MATFHHGVSSVEVNETSREVREISTSVIGVVCTAADADANEFPINTPVLVNDIDSKLGKTGTKGTLRSVLSVIGSLVSCNVVVVRVEDGEPEKVKENVIGGVDPEGRRTGMQALLSAKSVTGVVPRIIGAPYLCFEEVATALVAIAKKLNGFVYVSPREAKNKEEAVGFRSILGAREVMVVWPKVVAYDSASKTTKDVSAEAYALGLRALIDKQVGWHKTISNVAITGPVGVNPPVYFDYMNEDTDAGFLNENEVTALVVDNGVRFWGNRTCDKTDGYIFESYTRTAQVLRETIASAQKAYADQPLSPGLVKDIISGINSTIRNLIADGKLLGGRAWLHEKNNTQDLGSGILYIKYEYTPVPPLEHLSLTQAFTDEYLMDFASKVSK